MATNTLGEFSDGEDDFVFEIDENLWNNSEDDDNIIRNIDEHEVLNQMVENLWSNNSEDDDNVIRNIDDDEVLNQTGRGEKRKSDEQDVEQGEYYYHIESVKKHHSKKFRMSATDHKVRFNNVIADLDLLESHERTQSIFPSLNRGRNQGHEPERSGTIYTTFRSAGHTYIHTFHEGRATYDRKNFFSNRTGHTIESGFPFK